MKWSPHEVAYDSKYEFPKASSKEYCIKEKITPKNGSTFTPGDVIRLELPSQGYLDPKKTSLEFDVTLYSWQYSNAGASNANNSFEFCRFQNNIQSIFSRARLLYGQIPVEDITEYDLLSRLLTEWKGQKDEFSPINGIGTYLLAPVIPAPVIWSNATALASFGYFVVNGRTAIQGFSNSLAGTAATPSSMYFSAGLGVVPNNIVGPGLSPASQNYYGLEIRGVVNQACTRRYEVKLNLGLFQQDLLIPLKFMASQLAIELTLGAPAGCIYGNSGTAATFTSVAQPTYGLTEVKLTPTIVYQNQEYDDIVLKGIRDGGLPIRFSSWNAYIGAHGGGNQVNLNIPDRSRNLKAIFTVMNRASKNYTIDNGACILDSAATAGNTMTSYQYRIGGRYFPRRSVILNYTGTAVCNGGSEALDELQKCLHLTSTPNINHYNWAVPGAYCSNTANNFPGNTQYVNPAGGILPTILPELDGSTVILTWKNGAPSITNNETAGSAGDAEWGNAKSSCYASSISVESGDGVLMSGLNAEAKEGILFTGHWSAAQSTAWVLKTFCWYESCIILHDNNELEVIQ